jgi:hypothetical protein
MQQTGITIDCKYHTTVKETWEFTLGTMNETYLVVLNKLKLRLWGQPYADTSNWCDLMSCVLFPGELFIEGRGTSIPGWLAGARRFKLVHVSGSGDVGALVHVNVRTIGESWWEKMFHNIKYCFHSVHLYPEGMLGSCRGGGEGKLAPPACRGSTAGPRCTPSPPSQGRYGPDFLQQ